MFIVHSFKLVIVNCFNHKIAYHIHTLLKIINLIYKINEKGWHRVVENKYAKHVSLTVDLNFRALFAISRAIRAHKVNLIINSAGVNNSVPLLMQFYEIINYNYRLGI